MSVPPSYHVEDGQKLECWICMNRDRKLHGTLSPEMERRLNEIGFVWTGQFHWDTMLRALTQFKQREGHCNFSHTHIEHLDYEVDLKLGA